MMANPTHDVTFLAEFYHSFRHEGMEVNGTFNVSSSYFIEKFVKSFSGVSFGYFMVLYACFAIVHCCKCASEHPQRRIKTKWILFALVFYLSLLVFAIGIHGNGFEHASTAAEYATAFIISLKIKVPVFLMGGAFSIFLMILTLLICVNHAGCISISHEAWKIRKFPAGFSPCIILCCEALVIALCGNTVAHHGISQFSSASRSITETIRSMKTEVMRFEFLSNNVHGNLEQLTIAFQNAEELNTTVQDFLLNHVTLMKANMSIGRDNLYDINNKINSTDLETIPDVVDKIEVFRYPGTNAVLCFLLVLCFAMTLCVIKDIRFVLGLGRISFLLSLIALWVLIALCDVTCINAADFCVNPEPLLYYQADGIIESDVLKYYMHCGENVTDPFGEAISNGTESLKNIQEMSDVITDIASQHVKDQKVQDVLHHLSEHIVQTGKVLDAITNVMKCDRINEEYRTALGAICTNTMTGSTIMLMSAFLCSAIFCLLITLTFSKWLGHCGNKKNTSPPVGDHHEVSEVQNESQNERESQPASGFFQRVADLGFIHKITSICKPTHHKRLINSCNYTVVVDTNRELHVSPNK